MAVRRLRVPEETDRKIQQIAQNQGLPSDQVMIDAIILRTRVTRRLFVNYALASIAMCVVTAFLVIVFAVFFLAAPQFLISITQVDGYLGRGLHWTRVFIQMLLPWPLAVMAVAWLFLRRPTVFQAFLDLFSRVRKLRLFGTEIELNEETRRKIQTLADDIMAAVREYKARVDREVERLAAHHQIDRSLGRYLEEIIRVAFPSDRLGKAFRCTVHIPSPVQEGYLYQLLKYHPEGDGAFRSFSDRFGIIGKVWRSEEPLIVGNLFGDIEPPDSEEEKIAWIMRDWGMTRREAEKAIKKPSYTCFLLESDQGDKLGVVYMDSENHDAFHKKDGGAYRKMSEAEIESTICNDATKTLAKKVEALLNDLSNVSIRLDLRGDR